MDDQQVSTEGLQQPIEESTGTIGTFGLLLVLALFFGAIAVLLYFVLKPQNNCNIDNWDNCNAKEQLDIINRDICDNTENLNCGIYCQQYYDDYNDCDEDCYCEFFMTGNNISQQCLNEGDCATCIHDVKNCQPLQKLNSIQSQHICNKDGGQAEIYDCDNMCETLKIYGENVLGDTDLMNMDANNGSVALERCSGTYNYCVDTDHDACNCDALKADSCVSKDQFENAYLSYDCGDEFINNHEQCDILCNRESTVYNKDTIDSYNGYALFECSGSPCDNMSTECCQDDVEACENPYSLIEIIKLECGENIE